MDAVLAQQYSLIACLGFCADVSASTAAGDRDSSRSSATAELMESVRQHVTATSLRSSGGSSGALSTPAGSTAAAAAGESSSGPHQSSSEHIQYLEELGSGAVSGYRRCREQELNLNAVEAWTMYVSMSRPALTVFSHVSTSHQSPAAAIS